jgi:hypothetical protein
VHIAGTFIECLSRFESDFRAALHLHNQLSFQHIHKYHRLYLSRSQNAALDEQAEFVLKIDAVARHLSKPAQIRWEIT